MNLRLFQSEHRLRMIKLSTVNKFNCFVLIRKFTPMNGFQYSQKSQLDKYSKRKIRTLHAINRRMLWIPPPWVRPLLRPLLVVLTGLVTGSILQILKGNPPQWLLTDNSNQAAIVERGTLLRRSLLGIGIVSILWVTRLRNPLWMQYLGITEHNLQLAEVEASKPWSEKWGDTKSANDTMVTRLKSMERYLGIVLSNVTDQNTAQEIQKRVNDIRVKGYTNGVSIALQRAKHWAVTGELETFEKTLDLIDNYISEGGQVDTAELNRVKSIGYSTKCNLLLAEAETKANQGDVSGCSGAVQRIREIESKCGTEINCGVRDTELHAVVHRANVHHVSRMLDEARKIRKNGSRIQAKQLIENAKSYALSNDIPFDEAKALQILQ